MIRMRDLRNVAVEERTITPKTDLLNILGNNLEEMMLEKVTAVVQDHQKDIVAAQDRESGLDIALDLGNLLTELELWKQKDNSLSSYNILTILHLYITTN